VQGWLIYAFGLVSCALIQWTLLSLVPLSLTYYEGGQAFRKPIKLWTLIRHAHHRGVELHGPLLYLDTGRQKGTVGGSWAALALASIVVAPWVLKTDIFAAPPRPPDRLPEGQAGPQRP
jgi:hypothetical protein